MKFLVAYYSRTGNTKTLGIVIGKALSADIDEIIDKKKRVGIVNWIRAGRDAQGKKLTEIQFEKNPQDYDLIVIGSPIWGGNLTPAVRTYLTMHNLKGKKIGFFIYSAIDRYAKVFHQLKEMTPESEHAGIFTASRFRRGGYEPELNAFIEKLK
ncbi:MAG: flavodoxin family protein [Candidatus Heimdallarchaeota archaeon]